MGEGAGIRRVAFGAAYVRLRCGGWCRETSEADGTPLSGPAGGPLNGGLSTGETTAEFVSLGNTLARWRAEILAHHDTGASNGPTEG